MKIDERISKNFVDVALDEEEICLIYENEVNREETAQILAGVCEL